MPRKDVSQSSELINPAMYGLQGGVVNGSDGALSVASASSVTIAGGSAWVPSDAGLYRFVTWPTTTLSGIAAASANYRLDQVVVSDGGALSLLAGSGTFAAASDAAALDARTSAASLAANQLRLFDIAVGTSGVTAARVRDRRPWARGAFFRAEGTAGYNTTSTNYVEMDATLLKPRIECSGAPVRLLFSIPRWYNSAANTQFIAFARDGAQVGVEGVTTLAATSTPGWATIQHTDVPPAGSHTYSILWKTGGGTATINSWNGGLPLQLLVEELVRQNYSNGVG